MYPTRGAVFTKPHMPLRSDIEAMDQPAILYISYGECATDEPFCVRRLNIGKDVIFHSEVDMAHNEPPHNT